HPAAKRRPVGAGVNQMKVPDLVHHLRGCERRVAHAEEVDELSVFLDRRRCRRRRPSVLAGEPRRERKLVAGIVDLESLNTLPEVAVGRHGCSLSIVWGHRASARRHLPAPRATSQVSATAPAGTSSGTMEPLWMAPAGSAAAACSVPAMTAHSAATAHQSMLPNPLGDGATQHLAASGSMGPSAAAKRSDTSGQNSAGGAQSNSIA